ncbi:hypothetical protein AAVH_39290, partial [Aphelenchoides avenae]
MFACYKRLEIPHQEDLLLAVFAFVSRDDLDAAHLTCTSWRDVVSNASGTLVLRPLQHVIIRSNDVVIRRDPISEAMPAASFVTSWKQWVSSYYPYAFRPKDFPLIMSLLRNGC